MTGTGCNTLVYSLLGPTGLEEEYDEDCSESEENEPREADHDGEEDSENPLVKSKVRCNSSSDDVSPKRAKLMDKHNKNERRR